MTTADDEKQYSAEIIEWDDEMEEYVFDDYVKVDGKDLGFDTYAEFLDFMGNLTPKEKQTLGTWRLTNNVTDEHILIVDGEFDTVNFLSLDAARTEK